MHLKLLVVAAVLSAIAGPSLAQIRAVERTKAAKAGKLTQIGVFGRVRPDCTSGPVAVRVIDQPDHGAMSERSAKLRTDKIAGCPAIETSVAVIFYQSNDGFLGKDEVVIEAETDAGQLERYHYRIEVQ